MEFSIKFILTVLLVFICSSSTTLAYPDGAPATVCNSMFPDHSVAPQSTTAPYTLLLGKACYTPGTAVTVTLRSNSNGVNFRGFLMQARTSNDGLGYYGTFNPAGNTAVQTLSCSTGSNDAITHRSSDEVSQQIFTWTAPTGLTGNVILLATVVQNVRTFWVKKVNATLAPCSLTETTTSPSNSSLTGGTAQSGATLPNSPLSGGTTQSGATLPNSHLTGGTTPGGTTLPNSPLTGGTTPGGTTPFNPSSTPRSSAPISLSNLALLTTAFMISAIVVVAM